MYHDQFCRCRDCKPPLVGQTSRDAMRLKLVLWVLFGATLTAIVIGAMR